MPTHDQPVSTTEDVLAAWSGDLSSVQTAPVRDAIVDGEFASQLAYQDATAYAAAQSDSLQATGEYLDEIGYYEHGIKRGAGELDDSYRARVNTVPTPCDPNDIINAANAILAPFTSIGCRYAERADGCFPGFPQHHSGFDSPSVFSTHVFADGRSALYTSDDGGAGATPNYPDRYYAAIPNRRPPGCMPLGYGGGPSTWPSITNYLAIGSALGGTAAFQNGQTIVIGTGTTWSTEITAGQWIYVTIGSAFVAVQVRTMLTDLSLALVNPWLGATIGGATIQNAAGGVPQAQGDECGRWFLLRVPDITGIDANVTAVYQLGTPEPPETPQGGGGIFPGNTSDGVSAKTGSYVWNISQTTDGVYQSVIDSVEALRGHGIRWSMLSDPILTN